LEQMRGQTLNEITARRVDITRINDKKDVVREFYMPPPALRLIPEVLERSGLWINSINVNERSMTVRGRIDNHLAFFHGLEYLRLESPYSHLFDIYWDWDHESAPDGSGDGVYYYIVITLRPNTSPFWLNGQMGGRS